MLKWASAGDWVSVTETGNPVPLRPEHTVSLHFPAFLAREARPVWYTECNETGSRRLVTEA